MLVLHERKSRVTLAARLTGKTAAETISAMLAVFGRIDPHLLRSITFDNDTAFAQHRLPRTMRYMTPGSATLMPHGKKAASKTPMDTHADGCRATSISTAHPTGKSRSSTARGIFKTDQGCDLEGSITAGALIGCSLGRQPASDRRRDQRARRALRRRQTI